MCLTLSPCPPPMSWTQPDDNSPRPESVCLGDNAVDADDDGVRRSHGGGSCEDDEEGHLVYHVGLVMKERCMWHRGFVFALFCPSHCFDCFKQGHMKVPA